MFISNSSPLYTNTVQPYTGLLFLNPVGADASVNGVIIVEFLDGFVVDGYTNIPYTAEGFSLNPGDYCAQWLYGNSDILINTDFVCESIIQLSSSSTSIQDVFNNTTNAETYSLVNCLEENKSLRCCVDSLTELKDRAEQDLLACQTLVSNLEIENQNLNILVDNLSQQIINLNEQIENLNQQIEDLNEQIENLNEEIEQIVEDNNEEEMNENNLNKIKKVISEAKNNPHMKYKKENYNNSNVNPSLKLEQNIFDLVGFKNKSPYKKLQNLSYLCPEELFSELSIETLKDLERLEKINEDKELLENKIKSIINNSQKNEKVKVENKNIISYNSSNTAIAKQKNLINKIKNNE